MTVTELARRLNLAASSVYGLENGYSEPSLRTAIQIHEVTEGAIPVHAWAERAEEIAQQLDWT